MSRSKMRSRHRAGCRLCHPWKFGLDDKNTPGERRVLQGTVGEQLEASETHCADPSLCWICEDEFDTMREDYHDEGVLIDQDGIKVVSYAPEEINCAEDDENGYRVLHSWPRRAVAIVSCED